MTVFKNYFKIAKRYMFTIVLYIVIFLGISAIMSVMSNQDETSIYFNLEKPTIGIINNDGKSIFTDTFIEYLNEKTNVKDIDYDISDIKDAIFYRKLDYVVVIPKGYAFSFINLNNPQLETYEIKGSYASVYPKLLIEQFLKFSKLYAESGFGVNDIVNNTIEDLKHEVEIKPIEKETEEFNLLAAKFNYLNYSFLAILILIISLITNKFKKENLKRRNLASSKPFSRINFELFLGHLVLTIIVWIIFMLLMIIMHKSQMFNSQGLLYIMNSFVFAITALALSFFIGNIVKDEEAAGSLANVVSLGTSFICGAFVPQILLGDFVLTIAKLFPSYYFILNNELIGKTNSISWVTFSPILFNLIIVFVFGVCYYLLTILFNKINLLKKKGEIYD